MWLKGGCSSCDPALRLPVLKAWKHFIVDVLLIKNVANIQSDNAFIDEFNI